MPPRAIHTFRNPSDTEDAEFFMTATPGRFSPRKKTGYIPGHLFPANSLIDADFTLTRFA